MRLKSFAFKEREQSAREKLRQIAKQDLVADLSRLFGDTTFSDVLFIVSDVEFQAHTAVLRARAPNFCQRFLPSHASPVSVQTCIQINGLEAAEFEAFIRSAYTDNDFKDYDESSYPWKKQAATDSDQINHVVGVNEQTENSQTSQDILNGMCAQCGCSINHQDSVAASLDPTVFDEQGDVTCTQSDCDVEASTCHNGEIVSDDVAMENNESEDPPQSNTCSDEFVINSPLQCASSCTSGLSIKPVDQESSHSASLIISHTEDNVASVEASPSPLDECRDTDVVDGLSNMAVEESCSQQTQTLSNQDINDTLASLCNDLAEGENAIDTATCELDTTHFEVIEDGFQSNQDLTVNCTAPNETSESDLDYCSCNIGQDLLQLLVSEVGSDVTFLVNGEKVKAHKAILCARSNYFSAMLHGNWVEGKTNEIPLIGVNYNGLMTVLKYMYGGTFHMESDLAVICDTLPLVDMYGLEGLKDVITCTLKTEKCHLFHKPCSDCITGVSECLEVSELFSLPELKKSCIKWMAKHFDRVLGTKGFTALPKHLQEELLLEIQGNFATSSVIEVLNHCDRLSSCTPLVKWTEPAHVAVSSIQESCLLFISSNFFSLVDETSFHEILQGVGWSIPVLEKIISAVKKHLAIENCCDQLRAILRLKRLLKLRNTEEDKESYPEEVDDLIVGLHNDCVKFIRCNFFKVTRSEGWKRLKLPTQREIKEGAVFSGLGDSGDRRGAGRGTDRRIAASSSSRPPIRNPSALRVGTDSRARGLGRGRTANNQERPSSARSSVNQGRNGHLAPVNKRPSSGRPASAQSNTMSGRGKMSSASKCASEKKPSSSQTSAATGSSRMSSSFSQNQPQDKRPYSARSSTPSGRGKMLSSKTSLNEIPPARSSRQREILSLAASNVKKSFSLTREAPHGRPLSAASSSGPKRSQRVSRAPISTSNSNSSVSKSCSREKGLSVEGSRVQTKKAPTKSKVQLNSRQYREQVTSESTVDLASCNSNESSASMHSQYSSSRKELFKDMIQGLCSTTQASKNTEQGVASGLNERSHSSEHNGSETRAKDEDCSSGDTSGAQATGSCAEETSTASASAENPEDNSLSVNEAADEHCPNSQCNDSPSDFSPDSLELD